MVYVMVYVAQTYTVAESLCASGFQRIYGIWVHVFRNFFGNSLWLVNPSPAYPCTFCINLYVCAPFIVWSRQVTLLAAPSHRVEAAKS
jgi:hypothetical protein